MYMFKRTSNNSIYLALLLLTNDMSLGFGQANSNVKRIYNWLAEVLVHGSIP